MQGEKPYRGARAGYKQRKRHFYEAQDRLQEVSLRIWNIRVRRREFETTTDAHCEVVGRFGSLADEVDADHVIWADLTDFYPELWAAFADITAEPSQSSRPRHWQPKARSEAAASAGGAAVGAPQPQAAVSEPKAPAAAPPLGVRGPTRDLYFPRRSDPLQQRGRTAQTEEVGRTAGIRATIWKPRGGLDDSWRNCPTSDLQGECTRHRPDESAKKLALRNLGFGPRRWPLLGTPGTWSLRWCSSKPREQRGPRTSRSR